MTSLPPLPQSTFTSPNENGVVQERKNENECVTMKDLAVECEKNIDLNSKRDSSEIILDVVSDIDGLKLVDCQIQKILDELKINFSTFIRILLTKAFKDIKDIKDPNNRNLSKNSDLFYNMNFDLFYQMNNFSGKLNSMNLNVKAWLLILQFVNGCSLDKKKHNQNHKCVSSSECSEKSLINFLEHFQIKDTLITQDFITKYIVKNWNDNDGFIEAINRSPDEMFLNILKMRFPWLIQCEKDYTEANNEFICMMILLEEEKQKLKRQESISESISINSTSSSSSLIRALTKPAPLKWKQLPTVVIE